MHFLSEYGLFVVKLISIVIAILIIVAGLSAIASKGKAKKGALTIKPLNKKYSKYGLALLEATKDKKALKEFNQKQKMQAKQKNRKRLFVINFHGDIRASHVEALREEVTAILTVAKPNDEILVNLESSGGMVNAYGLAASQLDRIRKAKLKLTVSVDKVAASGGYMMACIANHLIAAPFAIIGSIGVISQLPNFYHFLKAKKIDFEQITAGQFKRTLTMFGENTEKGRSKMQAEVNEIHDLFKEFVAHHRPSLNMETVATGEHWFGKQALDLKLIDEITTSDSYLLNAAKQYDLYQVEYKTKKSFAQKLAAGAHAMWHTLLYGSRTTTGQDYI